MNKNIPRPFGLRYEEQPTAENITIPLYDEEEDISIIIDEKGQKVPAVEFPQNMGTTTATKAVENSDEDPNISTRTVTRISNESSDYDDKQFALTLGTRTDTFVATEQTDEDPGAEVVSRPSITTKTATSVIKEVTDSD
jgi:hypothetical protein